MFKTYPDIEGCKDYWINESVNEPFILKDHPEYPEIESKDSLTEVWIEV